MGLFGRRDPGNRRARYDLGRSLFARGRHGAAVAQLAEIGDRTAEECHLLGRALARDGRLDEAARELSGYLENRDDVAPGIAFTLGCVHARRAAWAEAVAAFDRARGSQDAIPDLDLFTGVAWHHAGDVDRARLHLDRARETAPGDPRVHCARGALAVDLGDWAAARAAFTRAVSVAPDHPDARFGLGMVLEHAGAADAAAEQYTRGLAVRDDWHPARVRLAAIAITSGRPADGARILSGMVRAGVRSAEVDHLLALGWARSGDVVRAHSLWSDLLAAGDPDGSIAENVRLSADRLGCAAMARQEYGLARSHWELCRRLDPDDPRPRYLLGVLAILDGRAPEAADLLAAPAADGDVHAAYHLALALAVAGRTVEAGRRLAAIEKDWSRIGPNYWLLRGNVHAQQGQWSEAFSAYRSTLVRSGAEAPDGGRLVASFSAVTRSAKEAGALSVAVETLTPFVSTCPSAGGFLGLVHAELGDVGAALRLLPGFRADDLDDGRRAAVARAHLLRASHSIDHGDVESAAVDIDAATTADPGSAAARAAVPLVTEWKALAYARSGRPAEALAIWEELAQRHPMDLVAIHHIAVLCHRMMFEAEPAVGEPGPAQVRDLSHLLIACWAAVLESPAYWVGLARRRGRPISPEDRATVRQRFSGELTRKLRDHAEKRRADGAGPVGPSSRDGLDVGWGLELRAAAAVALFTPARYVRDWQAGFACGPLMLDRLAAITRDGAVLAARLRAAASGSRDEAAQRLHTLLSPLGRGRHLIDEGLLDDAVAELERANGSPDAQPLLAEAVLAQAVARAEDGLWGEAVTFFVRAAGLGAEVTEHADLVRDAAAKRVRQVFDEDGESYGAAVDALESVRRLIPPDPDFDADLGASYAELARRLNNQDDYEGAVVVVRKALALAPDDATTRRFARVGMGNLAGKLLEDGSDADADRAISLLREALTYAEGAQADQATRKQLAQAFGLRGLEKASSGDRYGGRKDLEEAVRLDPTDPTLRGALRDLS